MTKGEDDGEANRGRPALRVVGGKASARREPLTPEQAELVRKHQGMVEKIARTVVRRTRLATLDELRSFGHEGLVTAAQSYDAAFGVAFEGFAWTRVQGAMMNGLERERLHMRLLAAARAAGHEYAEVFTDDTDVLRDSDEQIGQRFDSGCDGFVASMVLGMVHETNRLTGEEALVARETYERAITALQEAKSSLPERDRKLIERHYADEVDLKAIAGELGVSYISARRYHNGAVERLGGRLRARGVTDAPVRP